MRTGGFGFNKQFGFNAPSVGEVAAAGPTELFPDPTLVDVTDATNGWDFSDGAPFFGPTGGTGPGISIAANFADSAGNLVGDNGTAFAAAVANSSTKTVALTIANFVAGEITVALKAGTPVSFAPSGNGLLSHSVTAGTDSGAIAAFAMLTVSEVANTFDITHISVT